MYPSISDLLRDLLGWAPPLPIQTFGFFLALSFLFGAYTVVKELQRKEQQGLLKPDKVSFLKGKPATISDYISAGFFGFLIGFKLVYAGMNYQLFSEDPQAVMLSTQGNWIAGIVLAAAAVYYRYYEDKKERLDPPVLVEEDVHPYQYMSNITMLAAVVGILGSKLFHMLENMDDFYRDPMDAIFSFSGLTFYGGFICAGIAVLVYANRKGIPPVHMFDATAPCMMLSYGIGRIGCQLSGDGDWGIVNIAPKPSWLSWAPDWVWTYSYPHNVVGEGTRMAGCEGRHCFELIPPVFPTPLYEAVACILLFFFLWSIRKKINTPGILTSIFLILNGTERFLIEHIRVNNMLDFVFFTATQAEAISMSLIIAGVAGLVYFRTRRPPDPQGQNNTVLHS